jgi:hypothetical protein
MVGIADIILTVISSFISTILFYIVLKIMNNNRDFIRIFIVVLIANFVTIFVPYLSMLGLPLPWYAFTVISAIITLFIFKFGLDLSWIRTILLVILTPIIAILIGIMLAFLGIGAILSLSFLS